MNMTKRLCLFIIAGALCIHFLGGEAFATEPAGNWRSIYDLIMRWINFLILAFVIVKFGKKPLVNFLLIRREETERTIRRTEEKKKKAREQIEEIRKTIDERHIRYEQLKEKMIEQGKKRKKELIEEAQQQSRYMLETAKQKAENQILEARDNLQSELMDTAVALAENKLPAVFTEEDNLKWISRCIESDVSE